LSKYRTRKAFPEEDDSKLYRTLAIRKGGRKGGENIPDKGQAKLKCYWITSRAFFTEFY
jgi:hypothetical protein